jgi:hypothetical protein
MNSRSAAVVLGLTSVLALAGCAANRGAASPFPSPAASALPRGSALSTSSPPATAAPGPSTGAVSTPEPAESTGTTTGGDIPDNAVFLTYNDGSHGFSVDYVEGWQVTPSPDGVVIRDKDSSETVNVVASPADLASYISSTDLPQLQQLSGFSLDHQDVATVGGKNIDHIVYHAPSPPDPVTGKEVPSTIDRYYVPGPSGLAIVTLSTPDGVDNVDAFRQMISSFAWK